MNSNNFCSEYIGNWPWVSIVLHYCARNRRAIYRQTNTNNQGVIKKRSKAHQDSYCLPHHCTWTSVHPGKRRDNKQTYQANFFCFRSWRILAVELNYKVVRFFWLLSDHGRLLVSLWARNHAKNDNPTNKKQKRLTLMRMNVWKFCH